MDGVSALSSPIEAGHQCTFDCRESYLRMKRLSAPRYYFTGQKSGPGR